MQSPLLFAVAVNPTRSAVRQETFRKAAPTERSSRLRSLVTDRDKCFLVYCARTEGSYTAALFHCSDAHFLFTAVALVGGFFEGVWSSCNHEHAWKISCPVLCAEVLNAILCLMSLFVNISLQILSSAYRPFS